ncbi:hypothetical protein E2C01_052332 [Portunus trituberculatus]|uniref:Uncharacterized protein n=1 Tax=Portunus trituberculatus TaxID=210409 RepID=A0A5B7GH97_PORTR|nr:hypothetical protein [Portunus trituberculatus]
MMRDKEKARRAEDWYLPWVVRPELLRTSRQWHRSSTPPALTCRPSNGLSTQSKRPFGPSLSQYGSLRSGGGCVIAGRLYVLARAGLYGLSGVMVYMHARHCGRLGMWVGSGVTTLGRLAGRSVQEPHLARLH